jgi:Domain of unknown function (DUF6456)
MLSPLLVDRNVPSDGINASVRKVRSVTVNLAESPLGWLRARGMLSERQFVAGEALRRDYERAGLTALRPSRRSTLSASLGQRLRRPDAAFQIYCGAWFVRGKACRLLKRVWAGPRAADDWC